MKFCVIGLGRFGYQLSVSLAEQGMEVLAIDYNESIVASIRDKVTQAVCMKVEDEESLRAIGVEDMDTVIVAMGENFAQSILITAILKKDLNVPKIIARAVSKIHENILKLVGASQIVFPERDLGLKMAKTLSLSLSNLVQVTENFAITELKAPKNFVDKTISELNLRKSRNITCIGVKKDKKITIITPDYIIIEDDILVLAGENEGLAALAEEA